MVDARRVPATTFGRRTFLVGATGFAGALTSLAAFGQSLSESLGQQGLVPVPDEARNVEAGLASFVTKWEFAGPVILLTRFGRFLSNRIFDCHVAGTPRSYHLTLGAVGATLEPGPSPFAHARLVLTEDDWKGLLYGDYTGLAPFLGGRAYASRDEANRAVLLAIVMYVFAHIPGGPDHDPNLTLAVVRDLFERQGLPVCNGEPEALEAVANLESDPQGEIGAILLGDHQAPPVTQLLAEWVHGLRYEDIPAEQIAVAKEQIKSILGVIYAGSTMAPGLAFTTAVDGFAELPEASVVGQNSFRTTAHSAAMANSFLAQILEWEDWTFLTHSGAAIVPVALAAAEKTGASGKEVLTAIVAGNEILARAGEFLTDVIHTGNAQAVHQLELPLVAGRVMGLSVDQLRDASGIACTQPQVTSIPSWTAAAKGLLTGAPAHTSVMAAELAAAGLTGRRDLLENPLGYFYRVADVEAPRRLGKVVDGLGEDWRFAGQYFNKRYPTDGFQLPAVHAMRGVREEIVAAGIDPADLPARVSDVFVRMPLVMAGSATMYGEGRSSILDRVLDPAQPDWTYIALLFDGPYPLAAMLRDGELTHRQYRDDRVADPGIRALYDRIRLVADLSMGVFGAEVTVTLSTGASFTRFVDCIRENVNQGFGGDEKFHLTAAEVVTDASRRDAILALIDGLDGVPNVRHLMRTL